MSEKVRGFVVLLSVLLWLPVLPPLLDGQMRTDEAVLRYGGALLLAWGGVSLIAAIVRAYTPEPPLEEKSAPPEKKPAAAAPAVDDGESELLPDGTPRRRAEDAAR